MNTSNDKRAFAVLATDTAVLSVDGNELKVLLTKAKSVNFKGLPTLPGGLVGLAEKSQEAAKRILKDVLNSTNFYMEQLYTFDDPGRDPAGRVVSVAYLMLIPWDRAIKITGPEATWYAVKNLPKLAYDHNEVVKAAVKRLSGKITYTNIVCGLMKEEFTLSDLQKTYEIIMEKKLDKRNFVKKMKSLKLVAKTGHKVQGGAHRPAALYKFINKEYEVVEVF